MSFAKVCILLLVVFGGKCKSEISTEKSAGSTIVLLCDFLPYQNMSSSTKHFWWFNDKLIFGDDFKPIDVGLLNVQATAYNDSISYLEISCISSDNEGNYTCKVDNKIVSAFSVKVKGNISSHVKSSLLNSSVTLTCCIYGNHVWRFNDDIMFAGDKFQPGDIGFHNVKPQRVNSTVTKLHIDTVSLRNTGNYSCSVEGSIVVEYFLKVFDLLLDVLIDGQDLSEVQYLLSDVNYNITCSLSGNLTEWNHVVSLTTSSIQEENQTAESPIGINVASTIAAFSRHTMQTLVLCAVGDEKGSGFYEEKALLDVFVIPELVIQKDEGNISGTYKAYKGEVLQLKCVAFGSRPAVDLGWKFGGHDNITYSKAVAKQSKSQEFMQNFESSLKLVVEKSVIITCCSSGPTRNHEKETSLIVEIDGWKELPYIIGLSGILLIAVLLLIVSQMRLRFQRKRRENAVMFALSVWQGATNSVPNGDPSVAMVTFSSSESETRPTDSTRNSRVKSYNNPDSNNSVSLLSLLHSGDCKEYWLGSYSGKKCICETVSERAHMKDGYNFLTLAESLRCLPNHPNVVTYLGSSTDEVPYYIYREYVEYGTLREFLLRNYLSHRGGETQSSDVSDGNESKPHLLTFARDVAEAMHFLHSNQISHPVLCTRKVLLDHSLICKLYDFVPSELISDRVANLMYSLNPPTAWFPPETLFLDQYDALSDIWSYGIFLWELFSFGEIPFQFKQRDEIEEEIRNKMSLPQPQTCPGAVYSIMLLTWNKHRENRPSFAELIHQIHPLQESLAEGGHGNDWNEQDDWNIDYFTLEERGVQYSVPHKQ